MARKAPQLASSPADRVHRDPSRIFATRRSITWFTFFALFFAIDVAQLGLVSQQIHKRPNDVAYWPGQELKNVFGLMLFASIVSLLFVVFHWALNLAFYSVLFFVLGIFWGVGAGVVYATPFGHGLQCGNPVDSFADNFQSAVGDCSRWTAVEGLAWALFGLSVIGFFAAIFDRFEFHARRNQVYDLEVRDEEKDAINRSASHVTSH